MKRPPGEARERSACLPLHGLKEFIPTAHFVRRKILGPVAVALKSGGLGRNISLKFQLIKGRLIGFP